MTIGKLRALGFCGADDSVHPHHLVILARAFPIVEFGVLFRPDKEGQPRYATTEWVERLSAAIKNSGDMKLAAHLCGARVNEVLEGNTDFLTQVAAWGFRRVQINATAVNGVNISRLAESVPVVLKVMQDFASIEFILQKNDETQPLWQGLLDLDGSLPTNVSMLVDESKGTGVAPTKAWPLASDLPYRIGYAGGIGPQNIEKVLQDTAVSAGDESYWIDMESSLRSTKNGADVFDLDKCYSVIDVVCTQGFTKRPEYLT